jgi:hypothetical protein
MANYFRLSPVGKACRGPGYFLERDFRLGTRIKPSNSQANRLSFLSLIAYNRRRSRKSYGSAIDVVPEVFDEDPRREQVLPILRTSA